MVQNLIDQFGRTATNLRVSLTDRCSLRCLYCMPPGHAKWLPKPDLLTEDEFLRLIGIAVHDLGVRDVRFTGGEPLLYNGVTRLIAATTAMDTAPNTALTTNGLALARHAAGLRAAGLMRLNVSLDTLNPARYARITGADRLGDVLDGLAAAKAAGFDPIKIDTVLLRGINDDEAVDLTRWAITSGYQLRFIEQMPLGPPGSWHRDEMITADEILAMLGAKLNLTPEPASQRGSAPAETWIVKGVDVPPGVTATVGVIGSVTRPFCEACNRTRLTADGHIRTCLFAEEETDIRTLLRAGADDKTLAQAWADAMWAKPPGHKINDAALVQPSRPMWAIGG